MNSLDEFFASINEDADFEYSHTLNPEEQECTSQNLYKCTLEDLTSDLFKRLEKETGVGLFDLKSIIASSNVINVDYILLISCRFCAESVAHKRIESCLVGLINKLGDLFNTTYVKENLKLLLTCDIGISDGGVGRDTVTVDDLLILICDRYHHDLRKGHANISYVGIIFVAYLMHNQLTSAYELVFHLCHSLLTTLPKTNQSWNCSQRTVTKSMLDQIVTSLSQVIQLQFIVSILDTLGREHSKHDMFRGVDQHQDLSEDFPITRELMEKLVANGRKFILSFRSLIPTVSYTVRSVLLHISVFVRPDLAYIILQNGYKVDWNAYLLTVQDLENSWDALIYARRHSKVDLWKSIDPDWRDEGYQYIYLISREESYSILKDKEPGTFMLIPQDLESEFCSQIVLTYRTSGPELYKNAIIRRERNPLFEPKPASNQTTEPKYLYRCGKYGPNGNLRQTLTDLAKIIPGSLLFNVILPPSLPLPGNELFAPKLDLNMHLWLDIQQAMPRWIQTVNVARQDFVVLDNSVGDNNHRVMSTGDDPKVSSFSSSLMQNIPSLASSGSKPPMGIKTHVFVDELLQQNEDSDFDDDDDDDADNGDEVLIDPEDLDVDGGDDFDDRATSVSGDTAYTSDEDMNDDHNNDALDHPSGANLRFSAPGTPQYPSSNAATRLTRESSTGSMRRHRSSLATLSTAAMMSKMKKRSTHPSWSSFDPEYIEHINHALVAMKAVMRLAEQSTSVGVLIEKLLTLDMDNLRKDFTEDEIERVQHCADHLWSSLQQQYAVPFAETMLRVLLLANGDEDERYDAVHSSVVLSLLLPMLCFLEDSDQLLRQQILPPPPTGIAMAPSLKFLPPYDQISSTFLYKATKNYYSRELYLLEKLLQFMLESVRVKTLKVPESLTGFGLTESIVPDCIAATDVMLLITKWREMLIHNAAAKAAALAAATAAAQGNKGKNSGQVKKPLFFLSPRASLYDEEEDEEDNDSFFSSKSPVKPMSVESNKADPDMGYSKRDWQAARTFGNVLQLLNVDMYLDPSELMHKLIFWMFSCKAIQEVTKPAETAFSIPQIYYHYVDHWETRVLGDPNALNDRVQLGRQFFSDATVESVNDVYNWKKKDLFTLSRDALENDFYCPYSRRVAAVLRASEIMQEVKRSSTNQISTVSTPAGLNPNPTASRTPSVTLSSKRPKRRLSMVGTPATPALNGSLTMSNAITPAPTSRFGPDSYQSRNERRQDWTYHFLQLFELLQVEEYLKKMVAHCHLYHLDVEQYYEKLYGCTSTIPASSSSSSNSLSALSQQPSSVSGNATAAMRSPPPTVPPLPLAQNQPPQQPQPQQQPQNLFPASARSTPRSPVPFSSYSHNPPPSHQTFSPSNGLLWQGSSLAQCAYITTLNQFLYKNALFARLLLPYRYVAFIQVDLYSLKEILGVVPRVNPAQTPNAQSTVNKSTSSGNLSTMESTPQSKPPSMNNLAAFFGVGGTTTTTNNSSSLSSNYNNNSNAITAQSVQANAKQQQQHQQHSHGAVFSSAISATASAMAQAAISTTSSVNATNYSSNNNLQTTATVSASSTQKVVYGANMGQSVTQNTLTIVPSTSMHHSHSMDVYAVIRLVKTTIDKRNSKDGNSVMGIFPTSKVHIDGSCITPVSRAEPLGGGSSSGYSSNPLASMLPPKPKPAQSVAFNASNNSTTTNNNNSNSNVNSNNGNGKRPVMGGKYSRHILAQVSTAVDFEWRTQGIFRFALPEGWLTLIQEEISVNMEGGNIGRQDVRSPPAMKIHITLYERNFFADSVLGEVQIPLDDLTEKNTVRDWFPIVHDKSVSWMLYAQAKLRFQMMKTEVPVVGGGVPHQYGVGAGNASSSMGGSSASSLMAGTVGKSAFSAAPTAAAAAITDAIGALKHNKRFEAFASLADRFRGGGNTPVPMERTASASALSPFPAVVPLNNNSGNKTNSAAATATSNVVNAPATNLVIAAPTKPTFQLESLDHKPPEESKDTNPVRFAKKIVMKKPANFIEDLLNS